MSVFSSRFYFLFFLLCVDSFFCGFLYLSSRIHHTSLHMPLCIILHSLFKMLSLNRKKLFSRNVFLNVYNFYLYVLIAPALFGNPIFLHEKTRVHASGCLGR